MPTDTTITDRLRALHQRAIDMFDSALADKLRYVGRHTDERSIRFWVEEARKDATIGLDALAVRDAADALTAAHAALAECYRWTGADPDGNEDWRLAERAVAEVKRLREESDAEIASAHAARDAAERKLAELTAEPICLLRDYQEMRDDLRSLLTTALRERDEARAALEGKVDDCRLRLDMPNPARSPAGVSCADCGTELELISGLGVLGVGQMFTCHVCAWTSLEPRKPVPFHVEQA